jgi:hypothetical protein
VTDGIDIGGRSRRFQAGVIVVTMLALLAGALAAATLTSTSPVDIDLGDGSVDGGEGGGDGGGGDGEGGGGGDGEGGGGGDGESGGGVGLPDFILDIIDGITDGDGSDGGDLRPVDPGEGEIPPPPYDITLDPTPTPGAPVVVTVDKNSTPVPFVSVAFDGERVGRTGPTGQVKARVPYTDELTVTARPPETDDEPDGTPAGSGEPFAVAGPGVSGLPAGGGRLTAPAGPTGLGASGAGLLAAPARAVGFGASGAGLLTTPARAVGFGAAGVGPQADRPEGSSDTYELPTEVTARVDGVALPGESATVRFTIAGNPLPAVEVRRGGQRVGVTGTNGTVDIRVPADTPLSGSVPVVLTRGEFASETTFEVGDIRADVKTGLLALPATGGTVKLTAVDSTNTEPLGDTPVAVTDGGEQVVAGETGENGTMSFTLPWTNSVTATATTDSGTVSTRVSRMFLHLAGLVAAVVLPLVGLAVWARQNPATRRRGRERLVGLLLAAGDLLERAGRRLARVARNLPVRAAVARLWGGLGRLTGWLGARLVAGGGRLRDGLAVTVRRLREGAWLALVLAGPRWLLGRLRAGAVGLVGLLSRLGGDEETVTATAQTASETQEPDKEESPQSAYERLRRCWQWLARRVVRRGGHRTETPTEIERRAVERGLPAGPVRRLRQAFQEVEYGPADPEERVDDARSAREHIEEETSETDR